MKRLFPKDSRFEEFNAVQRHSGLRRTLPWTRSAEAPLLMISSAPNQRRLLFTMKLLGDWTRSVREQLPPGWEIIVRSPYKGFDASKIERNKQVWVAGSKSLTPFLSKFSANGCIGLISLACLDRKDDQLSGFGIEAPKPEMSVPRCYEFTLVWRPMRTRVSGSPCCVIGSLDWAKTVCVLWKSTR